MPLKTFYNLKDSRKEEIRQVCYKEFALNDFNNASLSNIIKKLGLAKGSFYRYFKNKIDLYSYLLDYATTIRMQMVKNLAEKQGSDFFEILIKNFSDKINFDLDYPLESAFTYRVLLETSNSEIIPIVNKLKQTIFLYTQELLQNFQKQGQIKQNVDVEMTAFLIYQAQVSLYEYLSIYKENDFVKNIKTGTPLFSIKKDEIMEVVNKITNFIKHGISVS